MQETIYREHAVMCAIGEPGPILYPFVVRHIGQLTKYHLFGTADMEARWRGARDITGMYGRSGIVHGRDAGMFHFGMFVSMLDEYARQLGVVCSFDRAHPPMCPQPLGEVRDTGPFIVLDLFPPIEEIEHAFAHSLRKEIAKAERSGVLASMTRDHSDTAAVYASTMARVDGSPFYRVGANFFRRARESLGNHTLFYVAFGIQHECAISAELCLVHGIYAHSFLGGTTAEGLRLSANHLLKRDLIRELKRRGVRYYLLGGGHKPGDGIEAYKRQFAPKGVYRSLVGCRVFDQARYDGLKADMLAAGLPIRPERFQFYDLA
jgi:hypothetical protein